MSTYVDIWIFHYYIYIRELALDSAIFFKLSRALLHLLAHCFSFLACFFLVQSHCSHQRHFQPQQAAVLSENSTLCFLLSTTQQAHKVSC